MGNKITHQQDYIPATRNEDKNAEHKRSKREFALAASKYRAIHDNDAEDTYLESGFWS